MGAHLFLLTIFLAVAYGNGAEIDKTDKSKAMESFYVRRIQNECMELARVNPDMIQRIRHADWTSTNYPEVREWCLCVLMKAGLMTKEGVYKLDVIAKVPEEHKFKVQDMIDACLPTTTMPATVIAYQFMRCFQEYNNRYAGLLAGL